MKSSCLDHKIVRDDTTYSPTSISTKGGAWDDAIGKNGQELDEGLEERNEEGQPPLDLGFFHSKDAIRLEITSGEEPSRSREEKFSKKGGRSCRGGDENSIIIFGDGPDERWGKTIIGKRKIDFANDGSRGWKEVVAIFGDGLNMLFLDRGLGGQNIVIGG
ncbi:hypothetical protein VNO77_19308 [Canavalia gladiata]|uniref:Uncharacterized protein n=1 Tax=Canavalia gladiata TaxID=3824 RepID=A0AAN9LR41_CANGL